MLLKSKYIQPGIQVSVLIRHHLYSCSYTKLGLVDVGRGQQAYLSAAAGPLLCKAWFCTNRRQDVLYLSHSQGVLKRVELQVLTSKKKDVRKP
ncbi:hypothetical protein AV530_006368 [Patagioenas fasciata monilis]|uniref:Uncharacterized protein n=1 Tax=Patagioenas fasciata monilis TaxID=372326 RepID=A0A1V4KGL7_PATFA|nr:hypothetical protein AV530_006368 [Patagioenas fasciata monilis]